MSSRRPGCLRGTTASALRQKIGDDLAAAHALIVKLHADLDAAEREIDQLRRQRQRLIDRVAELEEERPLYLDSERLTVDLMRTQRDLATAAERLEQQNEELEAICNELTESLAAEREAHATSRREVECLEQQVDDLQALVDLLTTRASSSGG